jgi:AcrR family transcriptional regulator
VSRVRDTYHHGDLRNALVASAARLIETGGPEAFSLREAAREVGVSANAAYRHFDDKSVLMTAVATEGFSQLARHMRGAMEGATAGLADGHPSIARFKAVGRAYVEFAIDHGQLFRVMFGARGASCLNAGDPGSETPWTLLGQSLDALVVEGLLDASRRQGAELKAWSVVHGLASLILEGLTKGSTQLEHQALLESLLQFAVIGICAEGCAVTEPTMAHAPTTSDDKR